MWSSGPLGARYLLRPPCTVRGSVPLGTCPMEVRQGRRKRARRPSFYSTSAFVTTQILRTFLGARQIDAPATNSEDDMACMYATGRPPSSEKWSQNSARAQPPKTGHDPLDVVETGSSGRGVSASRQKMSPDCALCAHARISVLRCVGPECCSRLRFLHRR